jgi:hypothetical protein
MPCDGIGCGAEAHAAKPAYASAVGRREYGAIRGVASYRLVASATSGFIYVHGISS